MINLPLMQRKSYRKVHRLISWKVKLSYIFRIFLMFIFVYIWAKNRKRQTIYPARISKILNTKICLTLASCQILIENGFRKNRAGEESLANMFQCVALKIISSAGI
jgi:hypothetical protein